jgi:hypothetical protein
MIRANLQIGCITEEHHARKTPYFVIRIYIETFVSKIYTPLKI